MADLRKYGLVESRGITATERAKHIVKPFNSNERNEEISKAVTEIKLWHALYKRIGSNIPSSEDFKIHLAEVTKDRDKAISQGDYIRNIYKDAVSFLTKESGITVSKDGSETSLQDKSITGMKGNQTMPLVDENMIDGKLGEVYIQMPKNSVSVQIAQKLLEMMELKIKSEEGKSKPN